MDSVRIAQFVWRASVTAAAASYVFLILSPKKVG